MARTFSARHSTTAVTAVLLVRLLAFSTGRQLSSSITTTYFFSGVEQARQPPLAVVRRIFPPADEDGRASSDLEIFAEDPHWALKVEQFMLETGADTDDVNGALDQVRHESWAAGRTLRGKRLMLLAFAEDAYSQVDQRGTSRLQTAILAASRHASDAHFILVAMGFELNTTAREAAESVLLEEGWRSFTAVEVPEFEGFSSAVNRAMKTVPGNSIVAVLSTSTFLLPVSTVDPSTLESDCVNDGCGEFRNNSSEERRATDVFVAYERLRNSFSVHPPTVGFNCTGSQSPSTGEATEATTSRGNGCKRGHLSAEDFQHLEVNHHRSRISTHSEGLVVTAMPVHLTVGQGSDEVGHTNPRSSKKRQTAGVVRPEQRKVRHGQRHLTNMGTADGARATAPLTPPRSPAATRLSHIAPLPLLVFDTETFSAVGELDERFAFQGGIAEWLSRVQIGSSDQIFNAHPGGDIFCCSTSSRAGHGSQNGGNATAEVDHSTELLGSDNVVWHLHQREWSERFIRPGPDEGACTEQTSEWSGSPVENCAPDAPLDGMNGVCDSKKNDGCQDQTSHHQGSRVDEPSEWNSDEDFTKSEVVMMDRWSRILPVKLEALVQADADLFFLPLLLGQPTSAYSSSGKSAPMGSSIAFHSEWMGRAPDEFVKREILDRRKRFPVAVMVVVHDNFSLMRGALEEAALVVEHILVVVNARPWHVGRQDVSRTMELLDALLADAGSPIHGKLRVEVGSWATDKEQREYGSDIIREDPRLFARVVVMDVDEFWHPVELARALALMAKHPEAAFARAEMDTYWISARGLVLPAQMQYAVWLMDPHRCEWHEFREVLTKADGDHDDIRGLNIDRSVGIIRQRSPFEERQDFEQLQLRPLSGNLAVVDTSNKQSHVASSWITGATDGPIPGSIVVGADAVWSKLQEAVFSRDLCAIPPCRGGKYMHTEWADLGEEMSRIHGTVVIRRPDLATHIWPAGHLDFVKVFQSYFTTFETLLFPIREMIEGHRGRFPQTQKNNRFLDAVEDGDSEAARYLSSYYTYIDVPKLARDGYENPPTLVGIADVFINRLGYVWNEKDYVIPKSCKTQVFGPRASTALPTRAATYEKVFIIAQHFGDEYFHFLVEGLPRITLMLDVLQKNRDIKIAVHAPDAHNEGHLQYMYEFLELLGVERTRVILIRNEIHAALAILPSSTPCEKADTQMVSMLRHALLQAMYPSTGGRPPPVPRPLIVLIVRHSKRGLKNNDKVRQALQEEFPSFDLVEFRGTGPIVSQLELFATASLVVGPHGAGLANVVVSPLHTPILEVGPLECPSSIVELSVKLQHIYARHLGGKKDGNTCESMFEPDVGEVVVLVRNLLEGKRQADAAGLPKVVEARI